MRELKFRTWNPNNKKMSKGNSLKNACLKARDVGFGHWDDEIIMMQYTGLKDKNGKELKSLGTFMKAKTY